MKIGRIAETTQSHPDGSPGTLRAVVIGVGGQGLRRAMAIRLVKGWEIAAVCDFDAGRAQAVANRLGCPWLPDERHAIETPDADVVVIATPPSMHEDQITAALAANRHVLCEKPLAIHAQAARALAEMADARGLVLATGFNHRFYAPVKDVYAITRSNALGPVRKVSAMIGHPPAESVLDGWLGDRPRSGGGVLIDNGSHLIDLMRLFLGELEAVSLQEIRWHPRRAGIETHVRFRCLGKTGATVDAACTWEETRKAYLSAEIEFEAGVVRFTAFPWSSEIVEFRGSARSKAYWRERLAAKYHGFRAPGLESSLMHELCAIRHKIQGLSGDSASMPCATGHDGARAAAIVEAITAQAAASLAPGPGESQADAHARRCA